MIYGLDFLGGARYPKVVLKHHPAGWAAGFFANTFGDSRPLVRKLFDTRRTPIIRVHLLWFDDHTTRKFSVADINAAVAEAKKWRVLSAEHGKCLQISPWCEHTGKEPLLRKLHKAVMNELPDCEYVNTPMAGGDMLLVSRNEVHGMHPRPRGPYNYSTDGDSCFEVDIGALERRHAKALLWLAWHPNFNGKDSVLDKTPRPLRKAWPNGKLIREIVSLV